MKLIISLLLILTFTCSTYSQDHTAPKEISIVSEEIFSFVSELRDQIDVFFESEKKGRLERNLRYFRNDLRKYLKEREELLNFIINDQHKINTNKVRKQSKKVKSALDDLTERLIDLANMVSDEIDLESQNTLENVYMPLRSNVGVWRDVDLLLDGYDIDTGKITEQGAKIHKELTNSLELISEIRDSLK